MTRLFRSAAACLATVLLAAACTGGDPLSPSPDLSPAAQASTAKTLKKPGTTAPVDSTTVQSSTCQLSTDSSATSSDSTTTSCFGDTIPWGRNGDTIPWGK